MFQLSVKTGVKIRLNSGKEAISPKKAVENLH